MEARAVKRGRPAKSVNGAKASSLDIQVGASERQAFQEASELAGLNLSAWARARLRMAAKDELEAAKRPVAFVKSKARPDILKAAEFVRPSSIKLIFADGRQGTWTFRRLSLHMADMKLSTIKTANAGKTVRVTSKWNDQVDIDVSALRAAIDPIYASQIERGLLAIRGPVEGLQAMTKRPS